MPVIQGVPAFAQHNSYTYRVDGVDVRLNDAPLPDDLRDRAARSGFALISWAEPKNHLLLRCQTCGTATIRRRSVVRDVNIECKHCIRARRLRAEQALGVTFLGAQVGDHKHGLFQLPCGHLARRQYGRVEKAADGGHALGCDACRAAREEAEAQARGWQSLGPDPAGRINYRLYRHSCGHEQAIGRANMQSGRFNCAACGTGWASAPSYIYCMRFEPERHAPLVKLGFSRDPVSRLTYQLKRHPDLQGTILRSVPMSNGHAALCEEKRLHAHLHNAHPDAIVPRDVYRRWLRVKSEIYDAELEPVILAMLDRLADPGSDPD